MEAIEKNLKDICRLKGLTLTDVANRIGTTPSNLLSSVKGNPTISKIQDIANALQVSVSELLTRTLYKAQGVALIDGQAYQVSKPADSVVQLPTYVRYDALRSEIKAFVSKAIKNRENVSKTAMLETFEVFTLLYDALDPCFFLSLCYSNGQMMTIAYHRLEYGNWKKDGREDKISWDIPFLTEEIIDDIERAVPEKLDGAAQ